MRVIIAVYNINWVEANPLFAFLSAFGVRIKGQDLFGSERHRIKNTHLVVDDGQAEWVDVEGAKEFMKEEYATSIHYETLIYQIKKTKECSSV